MEFGVLRTEIVGVSIAIKKKGKKNHITRVQNG